MLHVIKDNFSQCSDLIFLTIFQVHVSKQLIFYFFPSSNDFDVWILHYLHRDTKTSDLFHPWQAESPLSSHSALTPAYGMSEKLISSHATTERPCDIRTYCQKSVKHTSWGTLRKSQGLDCEVGKGRRREGGTEDDPKLTGGQQMCHTLQSNKSFSLGNRFLKICTV